MIDSLSSILNVLWVIALSLIFFHTSWGIDSISKESKYTAAVLLTNNQTQCFPLLFPSLRFTAYAPCFIVGRFVLEKLPLKN